MSEARTEARGGRSRTAWRVVASLFALVMLGFGTANAVSALARDSWRIQRVVEEPVRIVDVRATTGGAVTIVGDEDAGGDVIIDMTVSRGLETPSHSAVVEGDRLVMRDGCLWVVNLFCQVDYVIHVPSGVSVTAYSDGRSIEVTNVHGDLDLESDGGNVVVRGGEAANARFDSDGGDVDVIGLSATSIEARSDGGSVVLELSAAPTLVDASSDGGDVELVLPDTADAYRVDVSSDGGSTTTGVRTDPTSDRSISAHSDGGDVIVRYRTA